MNELYIGLMSGTSADGIDAVIVDLKTATPRLIATHYEPYPKILREKILNLFEASNNEIEKIGELDVLLGKEFSRAANTLIKNQALSEKEIMAIGSHGQTIKHKPNQAFTLQIGDPNIIAAETGITTVADFRRKDLALGGQGAPLVPAFHQAMFASKETNRAVVNIGGIANVTLLSCDKKYLIGFDTGPGNGLMDEWVHYHHQKFYDSAGRWAQAGNINEALLQAFLNDPYFQKPPPKSTGREYFNLNWLQNFLKNFSDTPVNIQATLAELTAQSIIQAIQIYFSNSDIIICGGGVHNNFLMQRLKKYAGVQFEIISSAQFDIDPDFIEAFAFAWLAKQTLNRKTGNIPSVTGASKAAILGGIYWA